MKARSQGKLLCESKVCAFMNGRVGVPKIIAFDLSDWRKWLFWTNLARNSVSRGTISFTCHSSPINPTPRSPASRVDSAWCAEQPTPAFQPPSKSNKGEQTSSHHIWSCKLKSLSPFPCRLQSFQSRQSFYAFLNEVLRGRMFEAVIQACHLMETVCRKLPRWRYLSQAAL